MADDVVQHDERSPIDRAIDRVEQRGHEQVVITIPVMRQPHAWTPDAEVTLRAPGDAKDPAMMLWDPQEGAWRLIILPPQSEWRIAPSYQPRILVPRQ